MPNVILTQSLFTGNEFYIFRPTGNNQYLEIKFRIVKGEIIEDQYKKLHGIERVFIEKTLL